MQRAVVAGLKSPRELVTEEGFGSRSSYSMFNTVIPVLFIAKWEHFNHLGVEFLY